MKIRINGTDATKRFITSITKDFQKDKPNMSHIDYTACLQNKHRNSTLLTDENRGVLRNVSLLYVNTSRFFRGIRAAIGNNTGNMIIHQKPFFMSKETAVKHVVKFLEKLQPETAAKPQKVSSKLYHCGPIADKSSLNMFSTTAEFKNYKIERITDGTNSASSSEVLESYKNL